MTVNNIKLPFPEIRTKFPEYLRAFSQHVQFPDSAKQKAFERLLAEMDKNLTDSK